MDAWHQATIFLVSEASTLDAFRPKSDPDPYILPSETESGQEYTGDWTGPGYESEPGLKISHNSSYAGPGGT